MSPRLKRGEPEQVERLEAVRAAFRPAAPIDRRALFSGRTRQLGDVFDAAEQPGQHVLVYGERGVGKTSLAAVAAETLGAAGVLTARATCDRSDDYESVWRKALGELGYLRSRPGVGFTAPARAERVTAASMLADDASPHDVRRSLQGLAGDRRIVVFVDEFDRLAEADDRLLFADTIKTLSDAVPQATLVIVGVADDVEQLIAEHESIERALVQVHMPRMSRDELTELVAGGIERARMTIAREALETIVRLAQGLPHYAHLLGQLSARNALEDLRTNVRHDDVRAAVSEAIEKTQQTVRETYRRALEDTDDDAFSEVVLACAVADADEFGFFSADDVRVRGDMDPSQYLDALASPEAGAVLQRRGSAKPRYRFVNPLLQPYVLMRGVLNGTVGPDAVVR